MGEMLLNHLPESEYAIRDFFSHLTLMNKCVLSKIVQDLFFPPEASLFVISEILMDEPTLTKLIRSMLRIHD